MNAIRVITLTLLSLTLLPTISVAKNFQILNYYNGMKANKLPCKMGVVNNWLTANQYMCEFKKSKTDILEFQSDPVSQEIFQVDRYILLKAIDALPISKKLFTKYGKPNSGFKNKSFRDPLPMMTWGDSKIEKTSIYSANVKHPKDNGLGLSLQFLQCKGTSLGKCRNLFNITNNSPNLVVLNLTIFDAARYNYSKTVIETGEPPKIIKPIKVETHATQDVTDLEL